MLGWEMDGGDGKLYVCGQTAIRCGRNARGASCSPDTALGRRAVWGHVKLVGQVLETRQATVAPVLKLCWKS